MPSHVFLERLIAVSPMVAFRREGPDLELTYVSSNVSSVLDLDADMLIGSPIARAFERAHPDDRDKMRDQIDRALDGEVVELTYRLLIPGRQTRWVVSTVRLDPSTPDESVLLGYLFDITSHRRVEAELEWLALHDPLTGLANRAKFDSDAAIHLALSARKGWRTALFYIDLDRFKDVNDTYGHDAGDEVLETLAKRVQEAVRDGDLTARLGGDEFVVMLPDVGPEAVTIARRVHEALSASVELPGAHLQVGASIGIAYFPDDADDLDELRRLADKAMYVAKASGSALRVWSELETESAGGA